MGSSSGTASVARTRQKISAGAPLDTPQNDESFTRDCSPQSFTDPRVVQHWAQPPAPARAQAPAGPHLRHHVDRLDGGSAEMHERRCTSTAHYCWLRRPTRSISIDQNDLLHAYASMTQAGFVGEAVVEMPSDRIDYHFNLPYLPRLR